jgi:hypothetical protein
MEALFPALDPIPLPAPVWLFVALHTLTLALHFIAVHFVVGGLAVAIVWTFAGRAKTDAVLLNASGAISHRLPIVMTYVINLGVPPLLFAQVLYGRALYTSSVLIGVWWISIVALLIASYSLLYLLARKDISRATAWIGLAALVIILKIGMIYSANMVLMLRPELWASIYREAPGGTSLGFGDPTVLARWTFMMLGSLGITGVALIVLSMKKPLPEGVAPLMQRWGGRLLAAFTVVQIGLGFWVYFAQPVAIREVLSDVVFYRMCMFAWLLTAAVLIGFGVLASVRKNLSWVLAGTVSVMALANVVLLVLVRDGIRFAAFRLSGFNVWDRAVATNWSIVVIFLLVFVGAIAALGWLISVVARATPSEERYV